MSDSTGVELALAVLRIVSYVGFTLAAGVPALCALAWPPGLHDPRVVRLVWLGIGLSALGTIAAPTVRWLAGAAPLTQVVSREAGAGGLAHLAVLALLAGFLPDAIAGSAPRRLRIWTGAVAIALAATLAAQSTATHAAGSLVSAGLLTAHLVAVAVWLGGFVACRVLLGPGRRSSEVDDLVVRFLRVSYACLAVAVLTGAALLIAQAGGDATLGRGGYGLWLLLKLSLVVAMLVLGSRVRDFALDVAFARAVSPAPVRPGASVASLARVFGAELAIAGLVLLATSGLVGAGS